MIILKTDYFSSRDRLALFINENKIKREDILSITECDNHIFTIFFYGEESVQEITHGLFS